MHTHDMHKLTSERTPGTTASTAKVAEAKSGNFMLYLLVIVDVD